MSSKMDFQDYKRLTLEEKEFFMFDKLCKLDDLDTNYAGKWVEKVITATMGVIGIGFIGSILYWLGWHNPNS